MAATLRVFIPAVLLVLAIASPARSAQLSPAPVADPVVETLEPLMAAEFALQAGRLDEASRWYLQAAQAADDVALTERATRIALLARDDESAGRLLSLWRSQGGQGVNFLGAEASLALRRGDERKAQRHLGQLLAMPGDEGWRQVLGVMIAGARDAEQSARVLDTMVRRGSIPPTLQAWLAFGGLAQRLEQPAMAERIVTEVLKRFPGEPRVALLRVSQLRDARRNDEAREVLASIADRAGSDDELRMAIAYEYDGLGDLAAAEATLAQGTQDDQTYGLRASLLARANDSVSLLALYDELRARGQVPDPRRRLLLGQVAEFLKRFDEALGWYQGVPGGPQRWPALLRSANVLHELDRGPEAYAQLQEMQADASVNDSARRDAYLLEASLHERDKNATAAKDAFSRGLAAFPDDLEILYARALSWERDDDIARAEADLRRVLVIDPESVAALNALGYTLADRTDRYQEALELINRARAAEPDNAAITDSYGWVLYRLGRNEEALGALRQAFALQKDAEIAAHLAEVLWAMGRRDEARKYVDEATRIDPDNRALKRVLDMVAP